MSTTMLGMVVTYGPLAREQMTALACASLGPSSPRGHRGGRGGGHGSMAMTREVLVAVSRHVLATRTWLVMRNDDYDCWVVGLSLTLGVTKKIPCGNARPHSFIDDSTWLISEPLPNSFRSCLSVRHYVGISTAWQMRLNVVLSFCSIPCVASNPRWIVAISDDELLIWRVVNCRPQLGDMKQLTLPSASARWELNLTCYMPPKGDVLTMIGTEELCMWVCQLDIARTHASGSIVGLTCRLRRIYHNYNSGIFLTKSGTLAVPYSGPEPYFTFPLNNPDPNFQPVNTARLRKIPLTTPSYCRIAAVTQLDSTHFSLQQVDPQPDSTTTTTIGIYSTDSIPNDTGIPASDPIIIPEHQVSLPELPSMWIGSCLLLIIDGAKLTIVDTLTNTVALILEGPTHVTLSAHTILSP
ncbi:hypothetical protein Pelo_17281 [Pelomyxa schiedti]|nr:hypothetical protein Pelo_17281 [Pelomyxa schiedti]